MIKKMTGNRLNADQLKKTTGRATNPSEIDEDEGIKPWFQIGFFPTSDNPIPVMTVYNNWCDEYCASNCGDVENSSSYIIKGQYQFRE